MAKSYWDSEDIIEAVLAFSQGCEDQKWEFLKTLGIEKPKLKTFNVELTEDEVLFIKFCSGNPVVTTNYLYGSGNQLKAKFPGWFTGVKEHNDLLPETRPKSLLFNKMDGLIPS